MDGVFRGALALIVCLSVLIWPAAVISHAEETGVTERVKSARTMGVPAPVLARITALGVDWRLEPGEVVGFLDVITAARREGVPVERFLAKIEEGLAKRVPPARIQAVLQSKLDDYRFARRVMIEVVQPKTGEKLVRPEDLAVLADGLDLGLSRDELRDFLVRAPASPRAMMLLAAENKALLKQVHFNPELADKVLFSGLEHKRFTPQWRYLSRLAAAGRQKGLSDAEIAGAALEVLESGGSVKDLMARLGFTGRNVQDGPQIK